MAQTLFVSDLHLDRERPQAIERFATFLRQDASRAQAVYLLGDVFDYWIGDDDPAPDLNPALDGLRALTRGGVPTYVLHGNRDFLLGEGFSARTGCHLLPERHIIDLYGHPTLVMHGDTLCTDDLEYQQLRRVLREPAWQAQFLSLSLQERRRQAVALREKSREAVQLKPEDIMDVNAEAVAWAFREHAVESLIHGHTHRPGIHEVTVDGRSLQRMVLGDWYEHGTVLRCDADGCHLAVLDY